MSVPDDVLSRYGISTATGRAMLDVLDAIAREGAKLPSSEVIDRALSKMGESPKTRGVSRNVAPAIVYRVPSASTDRTHLVALYFSGAMLPAPSRHLVIPNHRTIIDGECSCEATTMCWHILTALAYAELDGYHLKTGREEAEEHA